MTIVAQESTLIIKPADMVQTHCVFEHWATLVAGEPPQCVYVASCPMMDVFRFLDAKMNSEWQRIFQNPETSLLIRIVATCDDAIEARNYAVSHIQRLGKAPICNARGVNLKNCKRGLIASNGERYDSQGHAAMALGVTQGAISRHLNGHMRTVGGISLRYELDE